MPIRGRFFHPKLVVIAGRSENRTTWVYLAVSSANLTLSGWGRNAESFGETWIHTRGQQAWTALDALFDWLGSHSSLGEKQGSTDAVARVRAALARMPTEDASATTIRSRGRARFTPTCMCRLCTLRGLPSFSGASAPGVPLSCGRTAHTGAT